MFFGILGPLEVRAAGGDPVPVGGPRVRALLTLLLTDAGNLIPTPRLIDGLYGDDPPEGAANALQSQVSRLRRGLRERLGADDVVEFHPAGYRLAIDPGTVDAHRFVHLARAGRRSLDEGDPGDAAPLLREALGLWRGPALADLPGAGAYAARLEETRITAAEDLAEADLALGVPAVPALRELAGAHPLRERPRVLLMRALHAAGRTADALDVYQDIRRLLADELGTDPSAELAAAHLDLLRAAPPPLPRADRERPAPPPKPPEHASIRPFGLPSQLTSFVGRDAELTRVRTLLADARLVTLLGPGGAGKTRLSIETGLRETTATCFVDLSPLVTGAQIPQALAGALGLRDSGLRPASAGPAPDLVERVIAALTGRPFLLILDNCEHLVADVAALTHRLLGGCPTLRVLATSREALCITGEMLCPVPRLALPPDGTTAEAASRFPAVRLFRDRAAAVLPGFTVGPDNVAVVRHICSALDGLPLAIELAAARLRTLPLETVAARLDDRFRLLSRGSRTAAPRHQTLRAVVEWSWDLLEPAEQELARRLTVFSGGATPEAVAAVCGLSDDETDRLLADLTDKSLLEGDGGRYRMLETIRAFCAERLAESGEEEALRRAHAEHFLTVAEAGEPRLRDGGQLRQLAAHAADNANLLAALRWSTTADLELALRLFAALAWYWWLSGQRGDAAPVATRLLDAAGDSPPAHLDEEYILCALSAVPARTTDTEVETLLDRVGRMLSAIRRPLRLSATILMWAIIGGPERADHTLHLEQLGDDPWAQALSALGQGYTTLFSGAGLDAETAFHDAATRFRVIGDLWGLANALDALALIREWRGDRAGSLGLLDEALDAATRLGCLEDTGDLLFRRAELHLRGGDLETARTDYEHGTELVRTAGAAEKTAIALRGLGDIARLEGNPARARDLYRRALTALGPHRAGTQEPRALTIVGLGRAAWQEGDTAAARQAFLDAFAVALRQPHYPAAAHAVEALAGLAVRGTDTEGGDGVAAEGGAGTAGGVTAGRAAGAETAMGTADAVGGTGADGAAGAGLAALLLGAATVLRGAPVPGGPDAEAVRSRAVALLGEAAFTEAWSRGAALTREEVLARVPGAL